MKHFIKGLLRLIPLMFIVPILFPLMIIDLIMWVGGADPMNTPIRKIIDRLPLG